jgi:hypothetical protein
MPAPPESAAPAAPQHLQPPQQLQPPPPPPPPLHAAGGGPAPPGSPAASSASWESEVPPASPSSPSSPLHASLGLLLGAAVAAGPDAAPQLGGWRDDAVGQAAAVAVPWAQWRQAEAPRSRGRDQGAPPAGARDAGGDGGGWCGPAGANDLSPPQQHADVNAAAGDESSGARRPGRLVVAPSPPPGRMPPCRSPAIVRAAGAGSPVAPKATWPQLLSPLVPVAEEAQQHGGSTPCSLASPGLWPAAPRGPQGQRLLPQCQDDADGISAILTLMGSGPSFTSSASLGGGHGSLDAAGFAGAGGVTAAGPRLPSSLHATAAGDASPSSGSRCSSDSGPGRTVARNIWAPQPQPQLRPAGSDGGSSSAGAQMGSPFLAVTVSPLSQGPLWRSSLSPVPPPPADGPPALAAPRLRRLSSLDGDCHATTSAGAGARPRPHSAAAALDGPLALAEPAPGARPRAPPLSPAPPPVPPSPKQLQHQQLRAAHRRESLSGGARCASPPHSGSLSPRAGHALLPLPVLLSVHVPTPPPAAAGPSPAGAAPAMRAALTPRSPILAHAGEAVPPARRAPLFSPTTYGVTMASPQRAASQQGPCSPPRPARRRSIEPLPALSPQPPARALLLAASPLVRRAHTPASGEGSGAAAAEARLSQSSLERPPLLQRQPLLQPHPPLAPAAPGTRPAPVELAAARPAAAAPALGPQQQQTGETAGGEGVALAAAILSPRSPAPPSRLLPLCCSPSLRARAAHLHPAGAAAAGHPAPPQQPATPPSSAAAGADAGADTAAATNGGSGGGGSVAPEPSPRLAALLDSPAYGVGYALTCGLVGVCFNDGSSIVSRPAGGGAAAVAYAPAGAAAREAAPGAPLPRELDKKASLLRRFAGALTEGRPWRAAGAPAVRFAPAAVPEGGAAAAPSARRAVRAPQGHVALAFSDGSLQVVFPDAAVLLLRPGQGFGTAELRPPPGGAGDALGARLAAARALLPLLQGAPHKGAAAPGSPRAQDCAQRDQAAA